MYNAYYYIMYDIGKTRPARRFRDKRRLAMLGYSGRRFPDKHRLVEFGYTSLIDLLECLTFS